MRSTGSQWGAKVGRHRCAIELRSQPMPRCLRPPGPLPPSSHPSPHSDLNAGFPGLGVGSSGAGTLVPGADLTQCMNRVSGGSASRRECCPPGSRRGRGSVRGGVIAPLMAPLPSSPPLPSPPGPGIRRPAVGGAAAGGPAAPRPRPVLLLQGLRVCPSPLPHPRCHPQSHGHGHGRPG